MRLVHLSDLHLGFRQYQRLTPSGINQREADVAAAFRRAIDTTIGLRPDLVLFAGDLFHNVRPTNPAIVHAFQQLARLTRALPDALVVLIAGNHDTPRSTETGSILRLFSPLGVHVVEGPARRLDFSDRSLSILAVPDGAWSSRPALLPDASSRYNVLLLHGEVEGMMSAAATTADRSAASISLADLGAARFNYVALGHYHVFREIAPNAFYAGSLEYTSANAWGELAEERAAGLPGKGLVEFDLGAATHRFHHLPSARPLRDLPPLSARGKSAREVDALIRAAVDACEGGIDDRIVRLLIHDLPRHIARELDQKALRDFRRRALHFHLDSRRPEIIRSVGQGTVGRRPSLIDTVRDKLRSRVLESDIDREALIDLGVRYLREVDELETQPSAMPGSDLA
ncbi:MAG: exonuclease SbcCD subunit D [Gemmatimonadaceae bacterium]